MSTTPKVTPPPAADAAQPPAKPVPAAAVARLAAIVLFALAALGLSHENGEASLTVEKPAEKILSGMENNTNRAGSDYDRFHIDDRRPDRCQSECQLQGDRCKAWTYVRPGIQHRLAVCYLKNAVPPPVADSCCISGVLVRPDHRQPPPVAQPAATGCTQSFVRREARPTDEVCVTPDSHRIVQGENATAPTRWDPNGPYGPNTCIAGYVWREAFDGDVVCVSPERRAEVKEENRLAPTRRAWAPRPRF